MTFFGNVYVSWVQIPYYEVNKPLYQDLDTFVSH